MLAMMLRKNFTMMPLIENGFFIYAFLILRFNLCDGDFGVKTTCFSDVLECITFEQPCPGLCPRLVALTWPL